MGVDEVEGVTRRCLGFGAGSLDPAGEAAAPGVAGQAFGRRCRPPGELGGSVTFLGVCVLSRILLSRLRVILSALSWDPG